MFDFDEIARRALSPHWQTLPPEEQAEFVTLCRDLLERFYMAQIEACGGERISFVGESIEGDFATVRSKVVTRRGTAGIYAVCVLRSASLRIRELSFATDDGGIWRHVQPRHRADHVTKDPAYRMTAGDLPVKSYLAVPVVSRSGEVFGGLVFGHEQPAVFSERVERIMAGIAGQHVRQRLDDG